MDKLQFRKDINGLRAIAIIGVVFFHAGVTWLPGGMAGVDVFFVISGFLMTSIIFKGIEEKNFSIIKFYTARANKIIPPLALLCFILLIFGWFFMTPLEHKGLIEQIISSLGFFSNVMYQDQLRIAHNNDTFTPSLWLLHTWSLSVEWQFYLIYPVIMTFIHNFISMKNIKIALILLTIISFLISIRATYTDVYSAYYLLHYRICGMLVGSLAYLYPMTLVNNKKKLIYIIGLMAITLTYLFYPGMYIHTPWPGYFSIFPILGTFLVLQANQHKSIIISNSFFQKIGKCSYYIYLWHLPIIFSINYFNFNANLIYLTIPLSFLIGFIIHLYTDNMHFNTKGAFLSFLASKPSVIILSTLLMSGLMY